jgi:hypothetical protein
MVVWEIENHGTGTRACFEAVDVAQIHRVVLSKGYTCLSQYELYAGFDEMGNEISIMPAMLEMVGAIKRAAPQKTAESAPTDAQQAQLAI